jgi:hypothetical protein
VTLPGTTWRVTAGVALTVLAWVLLMPPGAGPDEPSHIVRSAGLIRGQFRGDAPVLEPASRSFDVPSWVTAAEPGCYAFEEFVPATCRLDVAGVTEGDVTVDSTSWGYPIWGHLAPGVASLAGSTTAMRIGAAALPGALLVASLVIARRRSSVAYAATLLAATPQVWSTIAHVNPSGLAIAGGLATTTAWLDRHPTRLTRRLLVAGLVAMLLPRRDGPVWACALLGILLAFDDMPIGDRVRQVGRSGAVVLGLAGVAVAWHALTTPGEIAITALASPILIALPLAAAWCWRASTTLRIAAVAIGVVGFFAAIGLARNRRVTTAGDGLETLILGETGTNLLGTISDLSWLDTPVPQSFVFLWFVALGLIAGAALVHTRRRLLAAAAAVVALGVVLAWMIELTQDGNGAYFQGRYYLPLMIAVPGLIASAAPPLPSTSDTLARTVGVAGLVVVNTAFFAAGRRWGVGIAGSLNPLDWDTYGMAVPPAASLLVHIAGTAALATLLWPGRRSVHSPA